MARDYEGVVIRPPSEAGSFLLQVTGGCSHNRCTFCLTYKYAKFSTRPFESIREDIDLVARVNRGVKRVFMCDGNAMCLPTGDLCRILDHLSNSFPDLERVGVYTNADDILAKTPEELSMLHEKKLSIGYLGLESGNDAILERVKKGATADEMVRAVIKAQEAGIEMSVIVLLGLGSREMSRQHAVDSARAVSRMNPRYLSALTLMLLPGTPLYRDYTNGGFEIMDPVSILQELRWLVEAVEVDGCTFRTNHASNYLPVGGVMSRERERILEVIDRGLREPSLLRPESYRAL